MTSLSASPTAPASLRAPMLACTAVFVLCTLENVVFGADHGGAKHDISVLFFLGSVIAVLALVGLGVAALIRRGRTSPVS